MFTRGLRAAISAMGISIGSNCLYCRFLHVVAVFRLHEQGAFSKLRKTFTLQLRGLPVSVIGWLPSCSPTPFVFDFFCGVLVLPPPGICCSSISGLHTNARGTQSRYKLKRSALLTVVWGTGSQSVVPGSATWHPWELFGNANSWTLLQTY